MDRMNKFTVLRGRGQLHQKYAEQIRRERRGTAAVYVGATQQCTATFRIGVERQQFVKKFVSEQWILSCLPLVIHLSTTCNSHFWPKNAI